MTTREAKTILALHRPGDEADADPRLAAAFEAMRQDPALRQWYEQQRAFQAVMREKFRQMPAPAGLKAEILARKPSPPADNVVRPIFGRGTFWLAAAAAMMLLLGLAKLLVPSSTPDRFADFRTRMTGTVLRQYKMDVVSNDPHAVRDYMASRGAPADYRLTPGLDRLELAGGGFLRWRNHPVSMVCFYRPDKQMVYLFVVKRSALKDEPPPAPEFQAISRLQTASWTQDDNIYLLAAPAEPDFTRKYL